MTPKQLADEWIAAYWRIALEKIPDLRFELIGVIRAAAHYA
jgi:hypothetical protein